MTYERENVLVIPNSDVEALVNNEFNGARGLLPICYLKFHELLKNAQFMPRNEAEHNPNYRQVIPYFVPTVAGDFYLLRRLPAAGEQRLHSKIGCFGGHVRDTDSYERKPFEAFENGMWRELREELRATLLGIDFLGILVMDETEVDRVHIGAVFHIRISEPQIVEEDKYEPVRFPIVEWDKYADQMESWAREVTHLVYSRHLRL